MEASPKQLAPNLSRRCFPVWSPDGKHVLFIGARGSESAAGKTVTGANRPADRVDWWVIDIATGAVVKTDVLAELRKQGLSVWASAGAGIVPDLWAAG